MKDHLDGPGHLYRLLKRCGRIDQHVGTLFDLRLVIGADRSHIGGAAGVPAGARHRVGGVIAVPVRGLTRWRLFQREGAVAELGIGLPQALQVVGRELRSGDGPALSLAPGVGAHHEHTDGLFGIDPVGLALEPVVEPAQMQPINRVGGLRTKVDLASLLVPGQMDPGANNEVLPLAGDLRAALLAHPHEVLGAALHEHVIPAGEIQRRHLDFLVAGPDAPLLPVIIPGVVRDPIFVVGSDALIVL